MAKAVAHGLEPLLDTKLRDGALPGAGTAPGSGPIAPTWGGGGRDPLLLCLRGNLSLNDIKNGYSVMSILNWSNFSVEAVKELQGLLGFIGDDVDGIFGLQTQSAVKDFQEANGLTVDGIVGKSTLDALDAAQN